MKSLNLSEDCEAQLRGAILSGEVDAGSRLPPERVLASQLGVNRVSVRQALSRLSGAGLLSVRQGRGYTVRDFTRFGSVSLLPALLRGAGEGVRTDVLRDLLWVRRYLAAAVLERISEIRPDMTAVSDAVREFGVRVAAEADVQDLAEADLEVVAALLDASGSLVLQVSLNPVAAVLAGFPALKRAMYQRPEENLVGWEALLLWGMDPDPKGLRGMLELMAARDEATLAGVSG